MAAESGSVEGSTRGGATGRAFEVVAWPAERRLVLYVPAIEAATTVVAMADADEAVRGLIAELTGLPLDAITCDIRLRRSPGMLGGSTPLA